MLAGNNLKIGVSAGFEISLTLEVPSDIVVGFLVLKWWNTMNLGNSSEKILKSISIQVVELEEKHVQTINVII